jgi:hypothetical protein
VKTFALLATLLVASTAAAAPVLLEPVPSARSATTVNSVVGLWTADGVNQPTGFSVAAKPLSGASTPNLTWALGNLTAGQTYVAAQTYIITFADWNSMAQGSAPAGYKEIQASVSNAPWGTPSSGDTIALELRTVDSTAGWEILASPGFTAQAVAVPEPRGLALVGGAIAGLLFLRMRRAGRRY